MRKNYIKGRLLTLTKTALTLSNIRFRLGGNIRNISNKITRLRKILKAVSLRKSLYKRISYRSITLESYLD